MRMLAVSNGQPAKLELLNIDEWDEENTYDEDLPSCIHYSIECTL
jgi:hypothetical protein